MWKQRNIKRPTSIDSNFLMAEVVSLIKKKLTRQRVNQKYKKKDFREDNENEIITPKLNDTEKRELFLMGIIVNLTLALDFPIKQSRRNLLKHQGSSKESITTNINNKKRRWKISPPKLAKQQKRDNLAETTERSEGEELPNKNTAFTSQNVSEQRYQTRGG